MNNLDSCYMQCACRFAEVSKAIRKKVGAVIVTNQGIVIPGVNGMPSGMSNKCEHHVESMQGNVHLITKEEVIHAELNCILKAAKEGVSVLGSTLYVTLSPCLRCSSMIIQSGIKRVVYLETYRDTTGLDLLKDAGIMTEHFEQES